MGHRSSTSPATTAFWLPSVSPSSRVSPGQLTAPSRDGFAPKISALLPTADENRGRGEFLSRFHCLVDSRSSFPSTSQHWSKVRSFFLDARALHGCATARCAGVKPSCRAAPFLPQAAASCLGQALLLGVPPAILPTPGATRANRSPLRPPTCSRLVQVETRAGEEAGVSWQSPRASRVQVSRWDTALGKVASCWHPGAAQLGTLKNKSQQNPAMLGSPVGLVEAI